MLAEILTVLQYTPVLVPGVASILAIVYPLDGKRGKRIALVCAVLALLVAIWGQWFQQGKAEIQHKKALADQTKLANDAKASADFAQYQLEHLNHLAVHFLFELPASDKRVLDLMGQLDPLQGTPDGTVTGVSTRERVMYVKVPNLFNNPFPALDKLKSDFGSMSQGVVVLRIYQNGKTGDPDLDSTLHIDANDFSLCYQPKTPQSAPHLYARWATDSVVEQTWKGNGTVSSILDLSGAKLRLVLYPAPDHGSSALPFLSGLGVPRATVFFNPHECSLRNLASKLDPATPKFLIYEATLGDAKDILKDKALDPEPCLRFY